MEYARISKKYYCGIDMHAKNMVICIKNKTGKVLLHEEIPSDMDSLLRLIKPYKSDIAIACESTFNWYWLSDGCRKHSISFYLGHALYMKHIHGGKTKDDWIDSRKIADLLRMNMLPLAYDYPEKMRTTRDLLRRRHRLVQLRTGVHHHVKMYLYQQGKNDLPKRSSRYTMKREKLVQGIENADALHMIRTDLDLISFYDRQIADIEIQVRKQAKNHDRKTLKILQSIDGLGDILSLTILYEMHKVSRFSNVQQFSSYSRVVSGDWESGGKSYRGKNHKIGNPHLRWAFGQVASLSLKYYPSVKKYYERLKKKHGNGKSLSRLAHKFCVAIYYMLKNNEVFDVAKFCS